MTWFNPGAIQPGENRNPNGRPVGSRNKRTTEVLELIRAAGHQDPLITLAELQANSGDEGIRATAANMLAPYMHSKLAAKPQPPDPVYVEQTISSLSREMTIEARAKNIDLLTDMKATGKLDIATADSLISDQKVILYALLDERKQIHTEGGPSEQVIRIEGGLDHTPWGGDKIIMPNLNGHNLDLQPSPALPSSGDPPPASQTQTPTNDQPE